MELDKRDISALLEAYTAIGSILCGSLEHADPSEVMGIKGKILKLSIHASHFKHVAQTLYQKMEYPEVIGEPEPVSQEENDDSSTRVGPEEDG